jgi:hypothetical protein
MISEYDILAMMQDGDTADQVAQKLTDALNKGKALYEEEENKRKAYEAEQANQRREHMVKDLDAILDQLYDFLLTYYVENEEDEAVLSEAFKDIEASTIIDYIEQLGALTKSVNDFVGFNLGGKPKVTVKFVEPETKISEKNADEAIQNFLKSIGL